VPTSFVAAGLVVAKAVVVEHVSGLQRAGRGFKSPQKREGAAWNRNGAGLGRWDWGCWRLAARPGAKLQQRRGL